MRLADTVNTYIENYLKEFEIYSTYGTVKEIDDDKCTISIDKETEVFDVVIYLGDFQIIPKKGSKCIITFTSPTDAFLSMIEKIDRIKLNTGDEIDIDAGGNIKINANKIKVDANNITFNGGNNGGLVLVNSLVMRLNLLENDLNLLKTILAAWIPPPSDVGLVALKALITPWSAVILTPTIKQQLENLKIKQ